ncbi:MAG: hypothetical protein H6741_35220 [Alphaproteobacteria bacterium]|nr:hypothetical protein [Alphaproteobacteria bacterium]MCB9797961.1 hypothetical protein [Alphaproteobacteria bacterium]
MKVLLTPTPGALLGELREGERALSFAEAMAALSVSHPARRALSEALAGTPYPAFFWECAPVTPDMAAPFRFALVESRALAARPANAAPFRAQLEGPVGRPMVSTFRNLGGASLLVVPGEVLPYAAGAHLARFLREAQPELVDLLWRSLPGAVQQWWDRGEPRLWLSTSGLGVAWLHLRLDPAPKYYTWRPFKARPSA